MRRKRVQSSLVRSVGYDQKKKVLELEFVSGAIYRYADVPEVEYRDWMKAESLGAYVNYHIKDDYHYVRTR